MIFKNNAVKNNVDLLVNVFNYQALRTLIKTTLNKTVNVKDLKEGMIVNKYSFNDEHVRQLINDLDGNLEVYESQKDEFKYYFKSKSAGGITKDDVNLLKVMCLQKYISDSLCIKIAFPFTPAILLGLIIALSYGDLMMLITKNFVLVM